VSPEPEKLLEETYQLAKENNKMLRRVRGVQKRQALWSVLKIVVVIGLALGAFYYLEPYLNKILGLYNSISGIEQKINSSSLKSLLDKF
jgi:predicted MFS family arabinose efflux permease